MLRGLSYRLLPALFLAPLLALSVSAETDEKLYLEHVKTLAAPEMRGRGAGTPELEKAAEYIAARLEEFGVEPAGDEGSFFQSFTVTTGAVLGDGNRLVATSRRGARELKADADYRPVNFSSSGSVEGEVVFAGYGITAEEYDYDDYADLDVDGKIVVVMRYEPARFTEEAGGRNTHHAHLISKAINARNQGAAAVVLVNPPAVDKDELIKFGSVAGPDDAGIPMVQVKRSIAERWLRRSGRSLRLLERDIAAKDAPASFALGTAFRLELKVDVERKQARQRNVVGYVPGRTDEYVVVGAHYDHLGLGDQSSLAPDLIGTVHHGADDNASGVAGLLEIARQAAGGETQEEGLLLIAFAGEEIGLLGSAYWTENPTRPIEKASAMLNMDMIGRVSKDKVYIGGVGTAAELKDVVAKATEHSGFAPDFSQSGYSASDHTSFTAKGVPVLFFFSGLHGDYHKPSDTWDKIDVEEAADLVDVVAAVAADLRDGSEELAFVKSAPAAAGPHGGGDGASSGGGGGGYGPYFGSIPDFAEVPNGVRFADVRPGSPADKAGLKGGDVMTGWNGNPIANLYDFTYALRDSEVGETVVVEYERDGETATAEVKLEQRR